MNIPNNLLFEIEKLKYQLIESPKDDKWLIIGGKSFEGIPGRVEGDDNALGFGLGKNEWLWIHNCTIDAKGVAEALKFSRCWNVIVTDCDIYGGYEDCVDMVRGGAFIFQRNRFYAGPNTRSAFTIKGGVNFVLIEHNQFFGKFSSNYIIDSGNFTNYDIIPRPKTRHIISRDNIVYESHKAMIRQWYSKDCYSLNDKGTKRSICNVFWPVQPLFFWLRKKGWFFGAAPTPTKQNLIIQDREHYLFPNDEH